MNTERLLQLADIIENAPKKRFNMVDWMVDDSGDDLRYEDALLDPITWPTCSTAACVAGWAVAAFSPEPVHFRLIETEAEDLLGLTEEESYWLFSGVFAEKRGMWPMESITQAEAAEALRFLANGGDMKEYA